MRAFPTKLIKSLLKMAYKDLGASFNTYTQHLDFYNDIGEHNSSEEEKVWGIKAEAMATDFKINPFQEAFIISISKLFQLNECE